MKCPFKNCAKFLAMPKLAILIFSATIFALLFVFTMQYGFDLQPCVLCLWQRVPMGLAAALSLAALLWKPYGNHTQVLLALCALAFIVETGLALFHTGVELHWWLGTSGCAIQPLNGNSAEDLRTQLLHTVVARCDQISWTFLGLSMANWNVPFSAMLAVFSGIAATKAGK
jgi:disulfide bond formation protein DsbB